MVEIRMAKIWLTPGVGGELEFIRGDSDLSDLK
jgi:hypothetical protein